MISVPFFYYKISFFLVTCLFTGTAATQLIEFPAVFRILYQKSCRSETDFPTITTAVSQVLEFGFLP